jgi:CHAD domain-containing protein
VLDDVGSYGKQLNRILDALVVLIKLEEPQLANLGEDEKQALCLLKKLAKDADEVSRRAELRAG